MTDPKRTVPTIAETIPLLRIFNVEKAMEGRGTWSCTSPSISEFGNRIRFDEALNGAREGRAPARLA